VEKTTLKASRESSCLNAFPSQEQYAVYTFNRLKASIARASEMAKERQPIPGHIYLEHINALTDALLEKYGK